MPTKKRTLDARPDTLDFRDRMYVPTLVEVEPERKPDAYLAYGVPVLDQGREGACTGFGLATVANYLLRSRAVSPDSECVSPRMLYEMARRYDEWPGEDYEGSSARGAMKGWNKHGLCAESHWPYDNRRRNADLYRARWSEALARPLGAYFRVNHRDLVAMHSAITEVGVLFATATVHAGWDRVGEDGIIEQNEKLLGGHAFAVVGYDHGGFWLQNSWGDEWGRAGLGRMSYDDWLANGTDVWVARLGAPVTLASARSTAVSHTAAAHGSRSYVYSDMRPHLVSLGNDGALQPGGTYGTNEDGLAAIFDEDIPRLTAGWSKRRILLYAHGGLVPEDSAVQRVADYRPTFLENEVFPVAFIWRTDFWTTLRNVVEDALRRRRPEGILDSAKDFMLDRLDDLIEPLARRVGGKSQWDEMKENAELATVSESGGARALLRHLTRLVDRDPTVEIHIAGHSAGSILMARLVQLLTSDTVLGGPMDGQAGLGRSVASCTLWAPACTMALFRECYLPAIRSGAISRFTLFTLTDEAEQADNCANIYHKSLLYLVANAFEAHGRIPTVRDGVPLLGLAKSVLEDADLTELLSGDSTQWIRSPNDAPLGSPGASTSRSHGDFDDDRATLMSTLQRIIGAQAPGSVFNPHRTAAGQCDIRHALER